MPPPRGARRAAAPRRPRRCTAGRSRCCASCARTACCNRRLRAAARCAWLWLKLRYGGRLQTDGLCFICPGVQLEIGRGATLRIGRWAWIGHGCKIRVHEGEVSIGAKTVMGQECTISAYQHVSIGRECIIADRVMLIDFDHGVVEVERPIRLQGIYKRDVRVGNNVWIGYGACILRGVSVGDNSDRRHERGASRATFPTNAVVAGVPGARDPHARGARARCAGSSAAPQSGAEQSSAGRRRTREVAQPRCAVASAPRPSAARAARRAVPLEALARVGDGEPARDHEGPVAGLQREQLAHGAAPGAVARGEHARARPRARRTPCRRPPGPTRSTGRRRSPQLLGRPSSRMPASAAPARARSSASSRRTSSRPWRAHSSTTAAQPGDPLVPPVPEQLGVERAHDEPAARQPVAVARAGARACARRSRRRARARARARASWS